MIAVADKKPSEVLGGWYKEVIDKLDEIAENTDNTIAVVTNDELDEMAGGGE